MVKSKKLSRGSLAVLLMALMLALSMVIGMTGAWFTDSSTGTSAGTGTFGHVTITNATAAVAMKSGDPNAINTLVPGCELTLTGTVTNGSNVDVYARYRVNVTSSAADTDTAA
ncbi:MAG: hypothetical protein J6T39_00670, partial [Clostridia bacterium]|nr:hypothetical protein [Clostridia bacterium]